MRTITLLRAVCLIAGVALFGAATLSSTANAQSRSAPEGASERRAKPLVRAEGAMIVAANPLAARAGADVLRRGGSAADAVIAAQLVLNVVEPQSSGIGGGGFALYWRADAQRLESWDGRETAPRGVDAELFLGPGGAPLPFLVAVASGRSVGAPGLVRLLATLHERHGRRAWSELFEPAIALAADGFPVSPRLAGLLKRFQARLKSDAATRALYFDADGQPLAEGALLRNPALADTLRRIAKEGPSGLYAGPVAEALIGAVGIPPAPGALDLEDLKSYRVKPREPLCAPYRKRFEVCGMGPPSSGASTVGQILGLYERIIGPDARSASTVERRHAFLEASRLAYADRARYLADPDFVETPARGLLETDYLDRRAKAVDPRRASAGQASAGVPAWRAERKRLGDDPAPGTPGTTHLSVVDARGDIVSLTSSIESAFGSGRLAAGFLLNNQLTDFSFRPTRDGATVANRVEAGKRPRSSMAPTIVFERSGDQRRPILVLGSPGGSRIPEYVATALIALLDDKSDPATAAARAHVSHRNRTTIEVEAGAANDALAGALAERGHAVRRSAMTSGLHIIAITPDGALLGGADPRREGRAVGVPAR